MHGIPKLRIGLALGSGAARAWAHIGALRALETFGIRPDIICGTSIGALVGGFHLAGDLDELESWARRLSKLRMFRYLDFRVNSSGMIAGNRLFAEMERLLGDVEISDLGSPFAAVATDLYTGHEVWLSKGPLAAAIRASFSLPGIFEPIRIENRWVIDGALINPVPVSVCHALGAEAVIAINLNSNPFKGARAQLDIQEVEIGELRPAWSSVLLRGAAGRYKSVRPGRKTKDAKKAKTAKTGRKKGGETELRTESRPTVMGVLTSTLNLVQDRGTRGRLAADPPDVCITPKVGHIGLLDFHTAADSIAAGAHAVLQAETEIREALAVLEEVVA